MTTSQTETGLRLAVDGAVATVTLGRPERRNAMTPAVWQGLAEIGANLPSPVRVVVIRGEGPSFCAGIDLNLLAGAASGEASPAPMIRSSSRRWPGIRPGTCG